MGYNNSLQIGERERERGLLHSCGVGMERFAFESRH